MLFRSERRRYAETLTPPPRAIAGAPRRLRPIAWTRRCARSSSTSSPSPASWNAATSSPLPIHCIDTAPSSSSIPATSGCPNLSRASERDEGEFAVLPDLFPLFRVVPIVVTVAVLLRRRSVSRHRRAPLSFPSSPVTNSQRRLRLMVRNQIPRRSHPLPRPTEHHSSGESPSTTHGRARASPFKPGQWASRPRVQPAWP